MFTQTAIGTLGSHRIGAAVTVQDGRVVAGHYFDASDLHDIPLTGTIRGPALDLRKPGGGTFHLHLMGGRHADTPAPDLTAATGFASVWNRDGTTLPVSLGFGTEYPGPFPTRLYDAVTTEPDALFEARVRRFIHDVLAGDAGAASGFVTYPRRVNGTRTITVPNAAALARRWKWIFTPKVIAALRDAILHEMFVRNGRAMLGEGVIWFDAHGAVAVNQT